MKRGVNAIIMGAAGRDFHNFNIYFRENPLYNIVAFTAAQIPGVENRVYPPELSGRAYPKGIPIYSEGMLKDLIIKYNVKAVFFSYSDVSYKELLSKAALVQSLGCDFILLSPASTMLKPTVKSISICGVRTGVGKSPVTRYVAFLLKKRGFKPVIIRHPMPYGDLASTIVQRFSSLKDLDYNKCSIEEREDIEPHIRAGFIVYAGVDYAKVLNSAEREGDFIIWDGGNNDFPFYETDLNIVVVDALRPDHIVEYYPSEVNFRRANIIVITKTDIAPKENVQRIYEYAKILNPKAEVVEGVLAKSADPDISLDGKRVLVIEDGPSVTHGGLSHGAAYAYSIERGGLVVDPRPFAKGVIKEIYNRYPHIGCVLPAIGYNESQVKDFEESIRNLSFDVIVSATPTDLKLILKEEHPIVNVKYEFAPSDSSRLEKLINEFF
ncbi:MAG: GTPase [Candidatus Odinarchaeum yellowstonii]|uniref:GTPase n=1 Tax=Odinarchaeota yellowstonii (strain LCB_4) TaxID=1841599 RepID=A0AAF0D1N0_ODILC|nr:MAG: GTPase [Candidatus Odinarchaeum yellowstonii]